MKYFGSYANRYRYEGVTYDTCDIVFVAHLRRLEVKLAEEVRALELVRPEEVKLGRIAFKSLRAAVAEYIKGRGTASRTRHTGR